MSTSPQDLEMLLNLIGAQKSPDSSTDGMANQIPTNLSANQPPMNSAAGSALPMAAASNPAPISNAISSGGLNPAFSDDALQKAQEQSRKARLGSGIFEAIAQGGATMSGVKFNPELWKGIEDDANAPLTNLSQVKKALTDRNAALSSNLELKSKQDELNPDSPRAKLMQQNAAIIAKKAQIPIAPNLLNNLSPKDIEDFQSGALKIDDLNQHAQDNAFKRDMMINQRQMVQLQKQGVSRSELFEKTEQTKSRGAVKNAWEAQRQLDNIQSIFDENPNLDQMKPQTVNLLVSELAKVANGGVATEAGQRDLRPPDTYRAQFQAGLSKLTNSPTPAHLGEFLQIYKPYASALKQNAMNTIGESVISHENAYRNRVSPQDLQDFEENYKPYIETFKNKGRSGPQDSSAQGPSSQGSMVKIITSDGKHLMLPSQNLDQAKSRDPGLQVIP